MMLFRLLFRNAFRNRLRSGLTILGVAVVPVMSAWLVALAFHFWTNPVVLS